MSNVKWRQSKFLGRKNSVLLHRRDRCSITRSTGVLWAHLDLGSTNDLDTRSTEPRLLFLAFLAWRNMILFVCSKCNTGKSIQAAVSTMCSIIPTMMVPVAMEYATYTQATS